MLVRRNIQFMAERAAIILAIILVFFLSGCGGGSGGTNNSNSTDTSSSNSNDTSGFNAAVYTINGNTNGSSVQVSGNGKYVDFEQKTGYMIDSKFHIYSNVIYNPNTGGVTLNGAPFATIQLVPGGTYGKVAALICSSDNKTQVTNDVNYQTVTCPGGSSSNTTTNPSPNSNTTTNPPSAISCPGGSGGGTNGLAFYSPTGYTSYQLSTTSAQASEVSALTWGVQYNNSSLAAGSYSGSLRAELWAVSSSYSGGTIRGYKLGTFYPNFTGSGAHSSNTVYNGGYSTTTVQSSTSTTNPPYGSYCIVATLEEYNNSYLINDWIQFDKSVAFY